ncbi:MAG: DUF6526 family protein [Gemmatimonadaceae bacterium]
MAQTQTYASHTRYFPLFHFFAFPIVTAHAVMQTYYLTRAPGTGQLWSALVAWAIAMGVLSARVMAVRVQDRLIRLEETLRMQRVLPSDQQSAIARLSPRQMVALRFASDAELPDLVRRTTAGEFAKDTDIKKAVKEWRPDFLRA